MKAILGTTVLSLSALLSTTAFAQDTTFTINSFGGAYETAHRACIITPFEEETGVSVNVVTAYSADAFAQLRAQKDAPQFDVIHFSGGQEIVGAAEGLLAPIDAASLTNAADVYDFAKANLAKGEGPAYSIAAIGLIYNTDAVSPAPTQWADLLNPEYSEHLVLTDISNGYGMLGFLMLNQSQGGDLNNIQPGLDAVAKLLEAGALIVSTSPEIQQEFAQNDAWIAPYASDYAFTLRKAGLPSGFAQGAEGTPASYITTNVVAGRPNTDLALKFVDMSISPEAQECFAEALRYSPTNSKAELSAEVAADVAYGEEGVAGLIRFDPAVIEANRTAWVEEWNKTIAR
ncbi:ABC transporter substrate-binding protein [Devosia sp. J2-20]|jgi:putative spermidine/putrescine transport system substrate-binding protein|uniref:ABC transporter substrate-binding protein n=1 Tax=Devosia litorisediminis TaxID=2829817 RepID=A0A942E8L9_9HYPH|nr:MULTISPECIES: ABC transporter substrate-binding protein [Devosia]MBS3849566.1 ABC transporter substrate-binding protein [Devosia litorisediminis]MCZ4344420.1 ABC transporter substrate-binding protein [Devosia neptuniae]WDR00804.1 ABC transporter substrate-binding protein [Devosia sp. J2-20]|tara:strand:+ start:3590 stop:4624 length:1035 start_codon:yes stop_codon:yes gene_type:complete